MPSLTRRKLLSHLTCAATVSTISPIWRAYPAVAARDATEEEPSETESHALSEIATQFMRDFGVPGLSVAITRHTNLVYQAAYGTPDSEHPEEKLTPDHLFRIASVTKPITSAAIFAVVESGALELDQHIFGADGYLAEEYGNAFPDNLKQITLHHLLTHTAGGWVNDGNDPMFSHPTINHQELIEWTLRNRPLQHAPGTRYGYSNFGYCVLGRVIEKAWGKSYVEAVKESVLSQCNIRDMGLATNEQAPDEVRYFGQNGENPYSTNMNIPRMDSHGGWLATATDLVRFAVCVDGFESSPNILRPETVQKMTTPTTASGNYACGWQVNSVPNWWHSGSLPGTSTLLVRTASGLCWAVLTNTRTKDIGLALDQMMWKIVKAVPNWHA
ncbi:MAG: class A beta-lactamase-related serine hydrolase [Cytophagaceae bacterium]|nr:MAG: class A beta-lactamase-related serine hydrolase [Cytophagaceae bacterium]